MTYYEMKFEEILGLNKKHKMKAIQIIIESMISDKEHDIKAFYETEILGGKDFKEIIEIMDQADILKEQNKRIK